MTKIVRFPPITPSPSSGPSSSDWERFSRMPLPQRIRTNLDRLQVLALRNPAVARFLLEWIERFLTRHGV